MSAVLGVSVGGREVRAVLREGRRVVWAGCAPYRGLEDLAEVLARLTGEASRPVRRARVVLERDAVQVRTLATAPRLASAALKGYVALQAERLFRNGQGPLVCDVRLVRGEDSARWPLAAAAPERLVAAIARGCEEAGLVLESLGPAAEVLPRAAVPSGSSSLAVPTSAGVEQLELRGRTAWRSRLVTDAADPTPVEWAPPLARLAGEAPRHAAAYAATLARPRLSLLPPVSRARAAAQGRRRVRLVAIAAAALWLAAGMLDLGRLRAADSAARRELARLAAPAESAMATRRELAAALGAVATMREAAQARSRSLALLATLTGALGDSVTLVSVRVTPDSTLYLAGYAPVADRVVAMLERVPGIARPRLEGTASRQAVGGAGARRREWDRFAVVARLEGGL